jgi:5-methylthioribose kinase
MHLITADNAESYLRAAGVIPAQVPVEIRSLPGGVSNEVLYVAFPTGEHDDLVVKQGRAQLRTQAAWFCTPRRIVREVATLRICQRVLQHWEAAQGTHAVPLRLRATTPRVLHVDEENCCFAMTAAPGGHATWKQQLLQGSADVSIAEQCGLLLGVLHSGTWHDPHVADELGDRQWFEQLRLDPYYRTVAAAFPEAAGALQELIDSMACHAACLVHADFSPKNLLVHSGGLLMVDFETGHYGDPAFDLGFFLSHLLLKACYHAPRHAAFLRLGERFLAVYAQVMCRMVDPETWYGLQRRGLAHLAACGWARLDGISRVEYLTCPTRRSIMRRLCRSLLHERPDAWEAVHARAIEAFEPIE